MHGMSRTGTTAAAFADSNLKSFAVTAHVTQRGSIAADRPDCENLNRGENKSSITVRPDQTVTLACTRDAAQNIRIGNGSKAQAKLIRRFEPLKQKLSIEDARIITVDY